MRTISEIYGDICNLFYGFCPSESEFNNAYVLHEINATISQIKKSMKITSDMSGENCVHDAQYLRYTYDLPYLRLLKEMYNVFSYSH